MGRLVYERERVAFQARQAGPLAIGERPSTRVATAGASTCYGCNTSCSTLGIVSYAIDLAMVSDARRGKPGVVTLPQP